MNKYFQIYEYNHNLKACLAIYELQGKATLWWEEIKTMCKIDEKEITWEDFQRHFQDKYLTECFYDKNAK